MDPRDKLVMKIGEDVQTLPIEINVKSAGVAQEDQIFYTNDYDETCRTILGEEGNNSKKSRHCRHSHDNSDSLYKLDKNRNLKYKPDCGKKPDHYRAI